MSDRNEAETCADLINPQLTQAKQLEALYQQKLDRLKILKQSLLQKHLVEGYTINETRLGQLQRIFSIIDESKNLNVKEAKEMLDIIRHYTQSFTLLNQYDNQSFRLEHLQKNIDYIIEYDDIAIEIAKLKEDLMQKKEASDLFGCENSNAFKAITGNINQSFDGKLLYPNIEEQAANLLYLIVKNHPFVDGNKRIASLTFVWFLQKNNYHLKAGKVLKISNNALVALTLLIFNSKSSDKDLMIDLIVNLIGNDHE